MRCLSCKPYGYPNFEHNRGSAPFDLLIAIKCCAEGRQRPPATQQQNVQPRDAKYVARFEGLPSQFDCSNEPYNQRNTIQMNAWGADLGVEPGTSATLGAQRTAAPVLAVGYSAEHDLGRAPCRLGRDLWQAISRRSLKRTCEGRRRIGTCRFRCSTFPTRRSRS